MKTKLLNPILLLFTIMMLISCNNNKGDIINEMNNKSDARVSYNRKLREYNLGLDSIRVRYLDNNISTVGEIIMDDEPDTGTGTQAAVEVARADAEGAAVGASVGDVAGTVIGAIVGTVVEPGAGTVAGAKLGEKIGKIAGAVVGAVYASVKEAQATSQPENTAYIDEDDAFNDLIYGSEFDNILMGNFGVVHNDILSSLYYDGLLFDENLGDETLFSEICMLVTDKFHVELSSNSIDLLYDKNNYIINGVILNNNDFEATVVSQIIDDYFNTLLVIASDDIAVTEFTAAMMTLIESTWNEESDVMNAIVANASISIGYYSYKLWKVKSVNNLE